MQDSGLIESAAELLAQARRVLALTGAGISTASGIPDFRSEGTGLWSRDEPLEVASLHTFRTAPEKFFGWFRPLAQQICAALPNPAHLALAKLQKAGRIHSIVTQNIDSLHQKAGAENILEIHGTLATLSCTQCYARTASGEFLAAFIENGNLPHCPQCGALLKPDVILFGEQLPQAVWRQAQQEARLCDLVLVAGSSLEVLPIAGLPMQALEAGAHLIIINNSPTYLNARADVVILQDVAQALPAIAQRVIHG